MTSTISIISIQGKKVNNRTIKFTKIHKQQLKYDIILWYDI